MEPSISGDWRGTGVDAYWVDEQGRVWSEKCNRLLATYRTWNGYDTVNFGPKKYKVHQLVALAFCGPRPSPTHIPNHKNGVKHDNRAENLEWATPEENRAHASKHGLLSCGGRPKINLQRAREIRQMAQSMSNQAIAKQVGLTPVMIGLIVNERCWKEPAPTPSLFDA